MNRSHGEFPFLKQCYSSKLMPRRGWDRKDDDLLAAIIAPGNLATSVARAAGARRTARALHCLVRFTHWVVNSMMRPIHRWSLVCLLPRQRHLMIEVGWLGGVG